MTLKGNMQKAGIVLALAGALTLAVPRAGSAAPLRSGPQESLWERVLGWLAGDEGMGIDPNGRHFSAGSSHGGRRLASLRGKEGAGIDPDGRHSTGVQGATPSGDQGMGIDPDGRR